MKYDIFIMTCSACDVRRGFYCDLPLEHRGPFHKTESGVVFMIPNPVPKQVDFKTSPLSFRFDGARR